MRRRSSLAYSFHSRHTRTWHRKCLSHDEESSCWETTVTQWIEVKVAFSSAVVIISIIYVNIYEIKYSCPYEMAKFSCAWQNSHSGVNFHWILCPPLKLINLHSVISISLSLVPGLLRENPENMFTLKRRWQHCFTNNVNPLFSLKGLIFVFAKTSMCATCSFIDRKQLQLDKSIYCFGNLSE